MNTLRNMRVCLFLVNVSQHQNIHAEAIRQQRSCVIATSDANISISNLPIGIYVRVCYPHTHAHTHVDLSEMDTQYMPKRKSSNVELKTRYRHSNKLKFKTWFRELRQFIKMRYTNLHIFGRVSSIIMMFARTRNGPRKHLPFRSDIAGHMLTNGVDLYSSIKSALARNVAATCTHMATE